MSMWCLNAFKRVSVSRVKNEAAACSSCRNYETMTATSFKRHECGDTNILTDGVHGETTSVPLRTIHNEVPRQAVEKKTRQL